MKARHNHNEYIIWKIKQWFVYLGYFSLIYFPHIIHSLHQLQDVQYDKSKSNIGFDGNA